MTPPAPPPILAPGWTDAQRQEEVRLERGWRQANEALMEAGRATSAAWAAIAARRGDAKAVGEAIASEMFAMHGPRKG